MRKFNLNLLLIVVKQNAQEDFVVLAMPSVEGSVVGPFSREREV